MLSPCSSDEKNLSRRGVESRLGKSSYDFRERNFSCRQVIHRLTFLLVCMLAESFRGIRISLIFISEFKTVYLVKSSVLMI
jgi:hypothetical protein